MNELTREEREELVMIGKQLGTLTKADAKFILDETNSESAVNRRMITCRHRKMKEDRATSPCPVPQQQQIIHIF